MGNKNNHIVVILFVVFSSCNSNKKEQEINIQNKISINESSLLKDKFEHYKFINLNDDDVESRFTQVDKLKIVNDTIYILSKFGEYYLYMFSIDGSFIKRVGTRGKGPAEYNRLCDFDVSEGGSIYLYDSQNMKMIIYKSLTSSPKVLNTPFRADGFNLLSKGDYIFSVYKDNPILSDSPKVLITDSLFQIKKEYFTYNENSLDNKGNSNIFRNCSKGILYNKPVDENIFVFDKYDGKIVESYSLNFGNKSLPQKFKNDYVKYSKIKKGAFNYMYDTPLLISNYLMGNVYMGKYKGLLLSEINTKNTFLRKFIPEEVRINKLFEPLYIMDDEIIISYLDLQVYDMRKNLDSIGDNTKRHIENGGCVLSLFKLKKDESP